MTLPDSEPEPHTGQPVGPLVDATPAQLPGPVVLQGRFGRLEKLAAHHGGDLWDAGAGEDRIWTYVTSSGPFADAAAFRQWVASRVPVADPYFYAIVDSGGRAVGLITLMAIRPEMRVVEVGHVVYSPVLQRTPLATEAQYLLARYAFETLGYRRYEWKCHTLNVASRAAALRYGFTYEGTFRQHVIAKGRNRDSAWFSMLDSEWPVRKAAFERWLAPENFDAEGKQRVSLRELNSQAT
jgi:RimJ/RimL family protein N-acetyltransferase